MKELNMRDKAATCETCPWFLVKGNGCRVCRRDPTGTGKGSSNWCGQHPLNKLAEARYIRTALASEFCENTIFDGDGDGGGETITEALARGLSEGSEERDKLRAQLAEAKGEVEELRDEVATAKRALASEEVDHKHTLQEALGEMNRADAQFKKAKASSAFLRADRDMWERNAIQFQDRFNQAATESFNRGRQLAEAKGEVEELRGEVDQRDELIGNSMCYEHCSSCDAWVDTASDEYIENMETGNYYCAACTKDWVQCPGCEMMHPKDQPHNCDVEGSLP